MSDHEQAPRRAVVRAGVNRVKRIPEDTKICDCDLDLDPHPYSSQHFRACKAAYENADLTGLTCQIIRGHKGDHGAVVTQEITWSGR